MPAKKYKVSLDDEERAQLEDLLKRGKHAVRTVKRAQILLKAADGNNDAAIMAALGVSRSMVESVRERCVCEGVDAALYDKPRPGQRPKLSGLQQAHLIATACSPAPDGHTHWTLRLLADKVVEWGWFETISPETVRAVLQKTKSSRGSLKNGVFPK